MARWQMLGFKWLLVWSVFTNVPRFVSAQIGGPDQIGSWGPILTWPLQCIHMVVLKNGRVLCVDDKNANDPAKRFMLFNPAPMPGEEAIEVVAPPPSPLIRFGDVFCSGHAHLSDGRVAFFGGGLEAPTAFHDHTVVFDPDAPVSSPWIVMDDMPPGGVDERFGPPLPAGFRFYPTATALASGKILVTAGELFPPEPPGFAPGPADRPLLFNVAGVATQQYLPLLADSAVKHLRWYPFAFQLSDGRLFVAGTNYEDPILDPLDPESSVLRATELPIPSPALNLTTQEWSDNLAYAPIEGGSAVMYGQDRILKAGGTLEYTLTAQCIDSWYATDRAFRIDLGSATPPTNPEWLEVARMNFRRMHFSLVALPDGKLLAVGGERAPATVDDACLSVLEAELWDPQNADHQDPNLRWTRMANMAETRRYHSAAVLLPDARVLVAGGEASGPQRTAEIFSPPYLFTTGGAPASRPTISKAPETFYYGNSFTVESPEAAQVSKVSLIKLGAATHSFDHDQRLVPLSFNITTIGELPPALSVTAPAHGNLAPPGHYMLFIVANGVPSVSQIVRVDSCQSISGPKALTANTPPEFPKNRVISLKPGSPGLSVALQVTVDSLPASFQNPNYTGASLWVGPPQEVCELGGIVPVAQCSGGPTATFATLQCTPHSQVWDTIPELHVYHELIVPGGTYSVRAVGGGCAATSENFSDPLTRATVVKWGNTCSAFDSQACGSLDCWGAPDGLVNIHIDLVAGLDKFANRPGRLIKARADLEPATLDLRVNITDVTRVLDSFRGIAYPFPPPPTAPCS